jgi:hypothetical protein
MLEGDSQDGGKFKHVLTRPKVGLDMKPQLEKVKIFHMAEACKLLGISKGTMLRYEELGVFPSPKRKPVNDYRYYTEKDIDALRRVLLGEGCAS